MAIICREHGLLFIMTPRTACTAVGELLLTHYGGEYLPAEDVLDKNGRICIQQKHSTLFELLENHLLSREDAAKLLKFAAVRNPFDSLVSLYLKQRTKYQPLLLDPNSWVNRAPAYARNMRYASTHSFSAWVLKKCRKQLLKRLMGVPPSMFIDYTRGTDVVIRYENLVAELNAVFGKAGLPVKAPLPTVNRTIERDSADYRTWYSHSTAAAVRLAYGEDFRLYGYRF
jgi:Sulfotransferase family